LAAFAAPHFNKRIVNATLFAIDTLINVSACAQRCLDTEACIAFTWHPDSQAGGGSTCVGSGWSSRFATEAAAPTAAYYVSSQAICCCL
jgi:hypothetical protein